jgi:hypothetical protein
MDASLHLQGSIFVQNIGSLYMAFYIVAYFLKARNVEPDKQSLLPNSSESTSVSRQQIPNKKE